jgi:acetyltransferase-like isoleucine patch superfamily enzyme
MRNVTVVKVKCKKSSEAWKQVKPIHVVIKNWVLTYLANKFPGKTKIKFYKLMGLKIGANAQIMPDQKIDIFFPEKISIGENSIIGQNCFFACHEFNVAEFRYGSIEIGKNVLIGARSFILPGVKIGDGSLVGAGTVIYKDVPENVLAVGSPLVFKKLKKNN